MSDVSMDVVGDGFSIHVDGRPGPSGDPCLALMHEYIEGWYSTPDLKVDVHPRHTGNGNFQTPADRVLYESRTVTAHVLAYGNGRDEVVEWATKLNRTAGGLVTVTVFDGGVSTWARGYCQLNFDASHYEDAMPGTLTVVCDDPRRYGTRRSGTVVPAVVGSGLRFEGEGEALRFPVYFGEAVGGEALLMENAGTATAYPTITVRGAEGPVVTCDGCAEPLSFQTGSVNGAELVVDCLNRTVTAGGADAGRLLATRGFPSIPPGGSVSITVTDPDPGCTAEVVWHDTYI